MTGGRNHGKEKEEQDNNLGDSSMRVIGHIIAFMFQVYLYRSGRGRFLGKTVF